MLLLNASRVSHKLLYHLPVHKRLAAEEVNLKVASCARIGNQEVKRLLAHLKAHHCAVALIFALTGKAIRAVKITGMSHVQAERLNDIAVVFVVIRQLFILVLGIELSTLLQRLYVTDTKKNILSRYIGHMTVFFKHRRHYLLLCGAFVHGDYIVSHLINGVYRAAAGVKNYVISV